MENNPSGYYWIKSLQNSLGMFVALWDLSAREWYFIGLEAPIKEIEFDKYWEIYTHVETPFHY